MAVSYLCPSHPFQLSNSFSMTAYKYSPLSVGASEIRLLTLLPGPFDAKIYLNLDNVVLTENHVPQYEALSYAWGSAESHVNIFIGTQLRTSTGLLQRAAITSGAKAKRSIDSPVKSIVDKKKRTSDRPSRRAALRSGVTPANIRTLAITRNLFIALQHLRHGDRPRVLWIDAICVDQENLAERSQQVARMADIFSLANRVLVGLGLGEMIVHWH